MKLSMPAAIVAVIACPTFSSAAPVFYSTDAAFTAAEPGATGLTLERPQPGDPRQQSQRAVV